MKKIYKHIIIYISVACFLCNSIFMHYAWAAKKETLRPLSTASQHQRGDVPSALENASVTTTASTSVSAGELLSSASMFELFAKENNIPLGNQQAKDLLDFLRAFSHYNLGDIISVRILRYSDRKNGIQVLLLRTDKGTYVLKRYPHSLTAGLITKNEQLREHLRDNDFPYVFADELLTNDGEKYVTLDGYGYILYPWEGYNLGHIHPPVKRGVVQMTQLMADWYIATQSLDAIGRTSPQTFTCFFSNPGQLLQEFESVVSNIKRLDDADLNKSQKLFLSIEYQAKIESAINQLTDELPFSLYSALPKTVINGDFQSRNVLVDDGRNVTVLIDLDDSVAESRLWDIVHNFFIWLNDLQEELKRPLTPVDLRNLIFEVLENYILALDSEEGLNEKEIEAVRSFLRGYLLYEVFYRTRLLPSNDPEDYHNTKPGDERFASDLNNLASYLSLLDDVDLSGLKENLDKALEAKKCVKKIFKDLLNQNKDPLLVPEDIVLGEAVSASGLNIAILRKAYHQQIDLLIRKNIFRVRNLEATADNLFSTNPEKTIILLKKARNILERIIVAYGFEEHYLSEYARLNRKIERICYTDPTLMPQNRRNHIVLIPTQNRSDPLDALLNSTYVELKTFHFGRYDEEHKIIFTIIEDSTDPEEIQANQDIIQKYRTLLKGLSSNYEIQYWDSNRQEKELDRINRVVFNNEWDMRETLYPCSKDRLIRKKGYARVRNLGLIIARRLSLEFPSPEETLITWIDDDTQFGTTVIHRNSVRESGVHAINYFEKVQNGFASEKMGMLLGQTTRDSVNAVGQLRWMSDILHVFEQASTKDPNEIYTVPSAPFSVFAGIDHGEAPTEVPLLFDYETQSPMTVGKYLLHSLETFKYFSIGRFPFRTLSYLPQDWSVREDSEVRAIGSQRMGGGDNASFLMGGLSQVAPYIPGIERGEDLFKNIIDAGLLHAGYRLFNTTANPVDHYRLSGRRIDILQEIFNHYLGIIRVNLFSRLIKNILLAKSAENFSERNEVFLALQHSGLLRPEWLDDLIAPEKYIDFSDWQESEEQNYHYLKSFVQKAQRVACLIRERGHLTDRENPAYFWLNDERYSEALQILERDFVSVFEKDEVVPQMEKYHRESAHQETNEHYVEFINSIKRYGQNLQNWIKFWDYKPELLRQDKILIDDTVVCPIQFLSHIIAGSESEEGLALSYSYLKLGDVQCVEKASSLLSGRIREQLSTDIRDNIKDWVIVNPGGFGINNAVSLVAVRVAEELGLPHFTLETGSRAHRESRYHYESLARAGERRLVVHDHIELDAPEAIKDKNVILIDDAIVTGTIMNEATKLITEAGAKRIEPYCLVYLDAPEDDSTFERRINRLALERVGIAALYTVLNDQNAVYTTRLVYYTFGLNPEAFHNLLSHLRPYAKLNLYMHAIEYFGSNTPRNFDMLAEALRLETGLRFPNVAVFKNIQGKDFFEAVAGILKSYKYRIPFEAAADIKQGLDKLLSEEGIQRRRIKVILYDLDGTLFRSKEYEEAVRAATQKFLSERLGIPPEIVKAKIDSLRNRIKILGLPLRQHLIAKEFGIPWSVLDNALVKSVPSENYITQDPELIRMLKEQREKGYLLGIISDGTCQQAHNKLVAFGATGLFEHIITADNIGFYKPEAQLYKEALDSFGVTPRQAIMVGDSVVFDILPAKSEGMHVLHVTSREDLLAVTESIQPLERLGAESSSYSESPYEFPEGRRILREIRSAA